MTAVRLAFPSFMIPQIRLAGVTVTFNDAMRVHKAPLSGDLAEEQQ